MNRKKPRVLIVDDNYDTVAMLRQVFNLWAWDVVQGMSCQEAIDKSDITIDLILLDLVLPDCSGVEVLCCYRELAHEVPIIVVTGNPASSLARQAQDHKPLHIFAKPVELRDLQDAVDLIRDDFYTARPHLAAPEPRPKVEPVPPAEVPPPKGRKAKG